MAANEIQPDTGINILKLQNQGIKLKSKKEILDDIYISTYSVIKDSFPINKVPEELLKKLEEMKKGIGSFSVEIESFVVILEKHSK
jgi:hypothetical protein